MPNVGPAAPAATPATPPAPPPGSPPAKATAPPAGGQGQPPAQNGKPAATPEKSDNAKAVEAAKAEQKSRKIALKFDKETSEFDLDNPDHVAEISRLAQLGKVGQKRMQEAAEIKKRDAELVRLLKEDPWAALSHPALGHDILKLAEQKILEQMESEKLTPEQRQLREYQEKIKGFEAEKRKSAEEHSAKEKAAVEARIGEELDAQFSEVLKASRLPKSPWTIARLAHYMDQSLQQEIDCSPQDFVHLVKQDYQREMSDLLGSLEGEVLLELLGDPVVSKIRATDLAKLAKPNVVVPPKRTPAPSPEASGLPLRERKRLAEEEIARIASGKK